MSDAAQQRVIAAQEQVAAAQQQVAELEASIQRRRDYEQAIRQLRAAVWSMRKTTDLAEVVDAVRACLDTAGLNYGGYGVNLVEGSANGERLTQYARGPEGSRFFRVRDLPEPNLMSRLWRGGAVVYRRDLLADDPFGELEAWAGRRGPLRRSVIDVPFSHGTLGVNSLEPNAFSDADVAFLERIAEVLAEAMQRWSDLDQLAQRNAELAAQLEADRRRTVELSEANTQLEDKDRILTAFHEVAKALLGTLDLEKVLDTLAMQVIEAGIFRSVMVALVDEERHSVCVVRGFARERLPNGEWEATYTRQQFDGTEYDLDDPNITAEVARMGRMEVIVGWDERFDARFRNEGHTDQQVYYFVPVMHNDRTIAVLATGSHVNEREQMLGHIEASRPFFDLVAIALYHARLYADLQKREQQLREAQRMQVMGELTAGIAHNFNNLLQALVGNLKLAMEEEVSESARELLRNAIEATDNQAELVRQLMAYSRHGVHPERRPVDLEAVVESVGRVCRQTFDRRVEVLTRVAPGLPPVHGDAAQLEQVLLNLSMNARDAVADLAGRQPQILIEADQMEEDEPLRVRLRVRDNGAGIDDDIQGRVFDPFFTTKDVGRGTGLGLSIVHGIAQQHGGRVTCASRVGVGSTFEVQLPASQDRLRPEAPPTSARPPGGTETILLIEDEEAVRRVARRALERYGYTVLMARDGQEGLEVLEREDSNVDLMLLDLSMPRMTGQEVLRRMDPDRAPPVILFSGYATEEDANVGAAAILEKPIGPRELLACIREILDRPKAR